MESRWDSPRTRTAEAGPRRAEAERPRFDFESSDAPESRILEMKMTVFKRGSALDCGGMTPFWVTP
jgi:hypothetical protein